MRIIEKPTSFQIAYSLSKNMTFRLLIKWIWTVYILTYERNQAEERKATCEQWLGMGWGGNREESNWGHLSSVRLWLWGVQDVKMVPAQSSTTFIKHLLHIQALSSGSGDRAINKPDIIYSLSGDLKSGHHEWELLPWMVTLQRLWLRCNTRRWQIRGGMSDTAVRAHEGPQWEITWEHARRREESSGCILKPRRTWHIGGNLGDT